MSKRSAILALAVLAAFTAVPASAQILANALPAPPPEGLPGIWTPAAALSPTPGKWSAAVSWAVTSPQAGLWTYWYKVDHLGAGPTGGPQLLKSATAEFDPVLVASIGPVLQFGQFETNATQSWAAELPDPGDQLLRWSHRSVAGLDALAAGESIYLWVRSPYGPGRMINFTLQNGTVAQTLVMGPAPVPEPTSILLAGLGLPAVAALRRKSSR